MPRARSRSSAIAAVASSRAWRTSARRLGPVLQPVLGPAELHAQRDQPGLRAVVQVALDAAQLRGLHVERAAPRSGQLVDPGAPARAARGRAEHGVHGDARSQARPPAKTGQKKPPPAMPDREHDQTPPGPPETAALHRRAAARPRGCAHARATATCSATGGEADHTHIGQNVPAPVAAQMTVTARPRPPPGSPIASSALRRCAPAPCRCRSPVMVVIHRVRATGRSTAGSRLAAGTRAPARASARRAA